MVTARSERPRFFEGQYIGAADLAATVDYARELAREGALGGQTWGICIGLELVEIASASGGFDYFVLPGMAFDGYGRPIVVLSPAPVPASLFAGMPTGNQAVWIRYDEKLNRGLRPGWESCDAGDAYARVRESYVIEAGPMGAVKDRQSGVDVAGNHVEDARLALISVDSDAPLLCDASIPHQTFPADNARWLVPLGVAAWTAGLPGSLAKRSDDARKIGRTLRRYVGQVAESVFAADGVLRLRDRMSNYDSASPADAQCATDAVTTDDLTNSIDAKTKKPLERLVGNELVWVEGNMRVTGDARLWGTRLELRNKDGSDGAIPLHLHRADTVNSDGGGDLQMALGATADGKTRLVAGVESAGTFEPKLQLKNDGRLAVGTKIPANVGTHSIVATTEADTSVAIASAAKKTAKLQFATGPALAETGQLAFDDNFRKLRMGIGTDLTKFIYLTDTGKIGIQTDSPEQLEGDANDLVIKSVVNSGMTLLADLGRYCRINFADDVGSAARRYAGSIVYDHGPNRMDFWTNSAPRMSIDANGNLGLGTNAPTARVQISSFTDSLKLGTTDIQAESGGTAARLSLQRNGGGILIGGSLGADQQVIVGGTGRVGIGNNWPITNLHVRGSISGSAYNPSSHVAFIENTAGADADVLALQVGAINPNASNNFITFFGGGAAVGCIEGAPGGVSLVTGAADFAECLQREADEPAIGPNRVVGVRNGRISRLTDGADALMITTDRAAVVGNVPQGGEGEWERVAMIGQVPVMIDGPVVAGDYIIASGRNDGVGIAVPRGDLKPCQAAKVVGRAWASSRQNCCRPILVAVGMGAADDALAEALSEQGQLIERLQMQVEALTARLEG
jgi:hypothetical protein